MFNIELHRVRFDANERSYSLQGLLKDEPQQRKRHPYRYHCRGDWGEQGGCRCEEGRGAQSSLPVTQPGRLSRCEEGRGAPLEGS